MSNYPPGVTGRITYFTVTYRCTNEDCPEYCDGEHWDVECFNELGGNFVCDEDSTRCPSCDEEGEPCG